MPANRLTCQRAVMLLGAGRPTGAMYCNVGFVNGVKPTGCEMHE
jgi:hypothetical protein